MRLTPLFVALPVSLVLFACSSASTETDDSHDQRYSTTVQPGVCSAHFDKAAGFSAPSPCIPMTKTEAFLMDELTRFWGFSPSGVCSYTGGARTGCGIMPPDNAAYCELDDSISWDENFLNQIDSAQGDYAEIAALAHEFGHLVQNRAGFRMSPFTPVMGVELHADCLAGVFTATQSARGTADKGDPKEGFNTICSMGDPAGAWFNPDAHGSCQQRSSAFATGYNGAVKAIQQICSDDAVKTALAICPLPGSSPSSPTH